MVEMHNFLDRLVPGSPRMGRAEYSQDDSSGISDGRGNGKRPMSNGGGNGNGSGGKKFHPDKPWDGYKDKSKGSRGGKGKGKMRKKRRLNLNAIMKALTPKEQQRHMDEQICYKCHKPVHRMSYCFELKG
jgi:hypothetical protein